MPESFVEVFEQLPLGEWMEAGATARSEQVAGALDRAGELRMVDFARLISPAADGHLEGMAARARRLTRQRFGKVIRMFAPLYVSNECINNCAYCGFSRDNPIRRVTLSLDEVVSEARALREQGFRNLLLVAGEHPRFVSEGYLEACIREVGRLVPGVSIEVGPMETPEYQRMVAAGAEGLVVYQETYDPGRYRAVHTLGPKKDFAWRLATPERGYAAGFRRLGIGALFGLTDWRREALSVAAHAMWLLRNCWKAQLTLSLPRLRPCAGEYEPPHPLRDRDFAKLICAFRLLLPDVGLVLSTREPAGLRDGLVSLGITLMSAGSHTEPGGYTGAGRKNVHYTTRGRMEPLEAAAVEATGEEARTLATGQFDVADHRSAGQVADQLQRLGLEPVWKDWDEGILARPSS